MGSKLNLRPKPGPADNESPESYWRRNDEQLHRRIVGYQPERMSRGGVRIERAMRHRVSYLKWFVCEVLPAIESRSVPLQQLVVDLCGQVKNGTKTREDVWEAIRLEDAVTSLEFEGLDLVLLISEVGGVW